MVFARSLDKDNGFTVLDACQSTIAAWDDILAQVKQIAWRYAGLSDLDIDCLDPAFALGTGTPVTAA